MGDEIVGQTHPKTREPMGPSMPLGIGSVFWLNNMLSMSNGTLLVNTQALGAYALRYRGAAYPHPRASERPCAAGGIASVASTTATLCGYLQDQGGPMTESKGYVDHAYLRCAEQLLRSVKEQSYARMRVEPGHKVLDVGCGPGTDTLPLAERVGAAGMVLGIDSDSAMLIAADRRARQARLSTRVSHQRGSAMSLPVRSEYFDASRCERLVSALTRSGAGPEGDGTRDPARRVGSGLGYGLGYALYAQQGG